MIRTTGSVQRNPQLVSSGITFLRSLASGAAFPITEGDGLLSGVVVDPPAFCGPTVLQSVVSVPSGHINGSSHTRSFAQRQESDPGARGVLASRAAASLHSTFSMFCAPGLMAPTLSQQSLKSVPGRQYVPSSHSLSSAYRHGLCCTASQSAVSDPTGHAKPIGGSSHSPSLLHRQ